jgi:hypothetical protein
MWQGSGFVWMGRDAVLNSRSRQFARAGMLLRPQLRVTVTSRRKWNRKPSCGVGRELLCAARAEKRRAVPTGLMESASRGSEGGSGGKWGPDWPFGCIYIYMWCRDRRQVVGSGLCGAASSGGLTVDFEADKRF